MSDRKLTVRLGGHAIGNLILNENGNLQFRYDTEYRGLPLSVALPVREEAYPHRDCLAWFGGLLPDGDMRKALARTLGTSERNDFRMLNEIGGDCAGAVEIVPEGWTDDFRGEAPIVLGTAELSELIERLPQRPLGANPAEGVRMSLAGAQPKLPVIFEPTRVPLSGFELPRSSADPTSHLLKPEPDTYPGMVANEFFCMTLARACGFSVALTDMTLTVGRRPLLMVRRYDREVSSEGLRRIHQEDFCQALLVLPEDKYQEDGGPSFRQLAELIRRRARNPIEDLSRLWDAAVFNWAIGNCDAHAKNFSLLYSAPAPSLAPLYDLVSTEMYPELSSRLAMSIGGARFIDEVDTDAWRALAQDMRIAPARALERATEVLGQMKHHAELVVQLEQFNGTVGHAVADRVRGAEL